MLQITRYVALDVHKQYILAAAIDAHQCVILKPCRVSIETFPDWVTQTLQATDAVVLEATGSVWDLVDLLVPVVGDVKVAHPALVQLIAAARVKTDVRDALHLARLLQAGLIPEVWIPPKPIRDLRALITHRERLVRQRAQARNRLQSLLQAHRIVPAVKQPYSAAQRSWWDQLSLSPVEALRVEQDLSIMQAVDALVERIYQELQRLSVDALWAEDIPYLMQIPGFGLITSMTVFAAIGDITRFASAKKLVGYSGLGASVHASGQTYRTGQVTKQGRRELRGALVEAAWMAVQTHPHWREQFERLAARLGRQKAIVAIARKLLVVVWYVLSTHGADRHALAPAVARKLVRWGKRGGELVRQGAPLAEFVRHHLDQLGIGGELEQVAYAGSTLLLPPSRLRSG
jgi:transposase